MSIVIVKKTKLTVNSFIQLLSKQFLETSYCVWSYCAYGLVLALVLVPKGEVCIRAKWPIRPELIPVSAAWSDWEYFYSPLDGMLVHRRVTPSIKFAGTHLYIWTERGTVGVKCLAQELNTMSPARAWTRTVRFGVERTNLFQKSIKKLLGNLGVGHVQFSQEPIGWT